jgi:hypothetical protein
LLSHSQLYLMLQYTVLYGNWFDGHVICIRAETGLA